MKPNPAASRGRIERDYGDGAPEIFRGGIMVGPSDGRNLPGDVDARDRVEEIDLVRRTAPAASFTDRRPVLRLDRKSVV